MGMTEILTIHPYASTLPPAQANKPQAPDIVNDDFFSSFKDVLDTINPLQHIPIVSSLYRQLTGDSAPSAGANIAAGALFGGPLGLVASLVNSAVETQTGKDIAGNVMALINGTQNTQTAEADSKSDYIPSNRRVALNSYIQAQSLV